jgi:putative ABC transport system permease protein
MKRAFSKEIARSITNSWGRFLAIAGIVALGCGFYAGLRMTAPDMQIAANAFYDGTSLYDLRLLSTLGFSDESVDSISSIDGIDEVMPSRTVDVMVTLDSKQYAVRIHSFDIDAAASSTASDDATVLSDDEGYLNRLILASGRWPTGPGECVLSADRIMGTPIQVGETVQVDYGVNELNDVLDVRTYTVVGLVHSSAYVSSTTLGSTSLGSGVIQQYMYVSDDNFAPDYPYTEIYATVAGAAAAFSSSDAYQNKVDAVADSINEALPSLEAERRDEVKSSAQKKLDEKYADYEQERTDALASLDDAQAELDDAAARIADGAAQIATAQTSYDAGVAELATARQTVDAQLTDAARQLETTQAQLDTATAQIATANAQLAAAWQQWQTGSEQLTAAWASYNAAYQAWEIAWNALDPHDPDYDSKKAALEAQKVLLDAQLNNLTAQQTSLDATKKTLDAQQTALDQKSAEVAAGRVALAAGRSAYEQQKATAEAQLDASQRTLDEGAAQIAEARAQLATSRAAYEEGRATYEQKRADALSKLDDAAAQLARAQADIDAIELPTFYVLDRTKNFGVASFKSDSERVDNIASVFPFIFFLVAALVSLTSMTRMVEEERVLIGTHKALGYHTLRITSKYLIYAGIASITGAVIGILALSQILPLIICKAYAIMYNVPQRPLPLAINMPLALLAGGLGVGITLIATAGAAITTLREQPAALMLPRAPKAGKRIVLEYITPLWRRVSFSWKVTLRNLFRYKKRFLMTIIGIAGCTALLLTGLGLYNAINDIIDKQYNELVHYNVIVNLDDDATSDDVSAVDDIMTNVGDMTASARAERTVMVANSTTHGNMVVQVAVPQDSAALSDLITLRERTTGKPVDFNEQSVILTEKLARTLGVSVGDTFTLRKQDDIGNATGDGYQFTVTGIVENYVGNYVYMGSSRFTETTGMSPGYTSLFALCTTNTEQRALLTDRLHEMPAVQTVLYNDETIDSYRKALSSVNMIVVVLVVAAAALAFIVLYNLTNINITERLREIASLKVLGFTPREVDAYIFREIILLTFIGAACGLVLGVFMESYIVVTAEVDQVMFGRNIHLLSFVGAFVLTILFSLLVLLTMRGKLNKIDMVESLKSIE